jgi:hypothetical protein
LSYKNIFQGQTNRSSLLRVHFYQIALRKEIKPTRNYVYPPYYWHLLYIGMTFILDTMPIAKCSGCIYALPVYRGVDQLFHGQVKHAMPAGAGCPVGPVFLIKLVGRIITRAPPRTHYFMIDPNFNFLKINVNGCNSAPLK